MIELKDLKLKTIAKVFKENAMSVRVGILGQNARDTQEEGGPLNNATVGLLHEFGTEELPQRSFLRIPLQEKLDAFLKHSKGLDNETIKKIYEERSLKTYFEKIGITAEAVVQNAFATGGFGKWKPSNMRFKKVHQTLIETQQLRNSITSEVKK